MAFAEPRLGLFPVRGWPDGLGARGDATFDELKTHQRGARLVLRSKSPDLVQQEIWGHLCCHYAIRTLMADGAQHRGHDPDRMSFVAALRIARQPISPRGAFPPDDTTACDRL